LRLRAIPVFLPINPPGVKSEEITRWQGTFGAKGLRFNAWPTARHEPQRPPRADPASPERFAEASPLVAEHKVMKITKFYE